MLKESQRELFRKLINPYKALDAVINIATGLMNQNRPNLTFPIVERIRINSMEIS